MVCIVESLQLNRQDIVWKILNYIYPPLCIGCGHVGFEICPECSQKIDIIGFREICFYCGAFTENCNKNHVCRNKREFVLSEIKTFGYYTGLMRKIVRYFKFNRRVALIRDLVPQLVTYFSLWNPKLDLIVPVPLTNRRESQRGYNQSAILAKTIATFLKKEYSDKSIRRIRETRTQVGLNYTQRQENVRDAFEADGNIIREKSILLIDDITTTGSTLNECAKALCSSGAKEVIGFTLARPKFEGVK